MTNFVHVHNRRQSRKLSHFLTFTFDVTSAPHAQIATEQVPATAAGVKMWIMRKKSGSVVQRSVSRRPQTHSLDRQPAEV